MANLRCANCGTETMLALFAQLPACSFGCAMAAGLVPVGLVVHLDGSEYRWTIEAGTSAELVVRAASMRRHVAPALVSEVLGWELELEPEALWSEHMGLDPEEVTT